MNPIHARLLTVSQGTTLREQLRELLSEVKVIEIDETSNGVDAFTLHQNKPYDVIVTEWDVRPLSGIDLLRSIRNGASRHTSVVLMSAEKLGPRTIEALKAGANGLIELPLDPTRAREKLRRIIGSVPERSCSGVLRAADLWSPGDAGRRWVRGLS